MCDYSLCGLPTRLAIEGEELVVHKFRSGSMGLASPADLLPRDEPVPDGGKKSFWERVKSFFEDPSGFPPATAVCVPPGAQLILKNVPEELQRRWDVNEEENVFFVQISAEVNQYRDSVRFSSGLEVLLQSLQEGVRVHVLSLGNEAAGSEKNLAIPAF